MDLSEVNPELRDTVRRIFPLRDLPVRRAWFRWAARAVSLVRPTGADLTGVRRERLRIGTARLRIFRPDTRTSDAALLWVHGGGLVAGLARWDDGQSASIARDLGIVVVAVDYRLAPRHPYPAALDDCSTAWTWLVDASRSLGVDPARIAVGGQSAGGGLAAALVQRVHDAAGWDPVAQWLYCPMLDDRTAARRELDTAGYYVWSNRANRFGWSAYLHGEPGAATVPPYAVPARRTDLAGLPPTWIGVGDIDLFHDEDRDYAERLTAAGVDTTLYVVPGAPHGFEGWAAGTDVARAFDAAAREWLRAALRR